MDVPVNPLTGNEEPEVEEITVEITEDNTIVVQGPDWELELSPEEARMLGDALRDAANEAESPTE